MLDTSIHVFLSYLRVEKAEAVGVKNHSEYDQRQAPRPIRAPTDHVFRTHVEPSIRATSLNGRNNLAREITTPLQGVLTNHRWACAVPVNQEPLSTWTVTRLTCATSTKGENSE